MQEAKMRKLRVGFTARCNVACGFCYFVPHTDEAALSVREHIRELKRAKEELGLRELSITGGEPILRLEDLLKYCEAARGLSVAVKVASNGIGLAQHGVLEKLQAAGVEGIQISLHSGPSAKTLHDEIVRHAGAFDLACITARRALKLGFRLTVRYTMMPENMMEAAGCFRYVSDQVKPDQFARFKVRECVETGRANRECVIKNKRQLARLREVYRDLIAVAQSSNAELELTQPYHGPKLDGTNVKPPNCQCGAQDGIAYLNEDGRVYPCQFLLHHHAWCIGNLRQESIVTIWRRWINSETCEQFRSLPGCMADEIICGSRFREPVDNCSSKRASLRS